MVDRSGTASSSFAWSRVSQLGTLQETERSVRQGEFSSSKPFVISKI
jgi:hypothetical protein